MVLTDIRVSSFARSDDSKKTGSSWLLVLLFKVLPPHPQMQTSNCRHSQLYEWLSRAEASTTVYRPAATRYLSSKGCKQVLPWKKQILLCAHKPPTSKPCQSQGHDSHVGDHFARKTEKFRTSRWSFLVRGFDTQKSDVKTKYDDDDAKEDCSCPSPVPCEAR